MTIARRRQLLLMAALVVVTGDAEVAIRPESHLHTGLAHGGKHAERHPIVGAEDRAAGKAAVAQNARGRVERRLLEVEAL